MCYFVTNIIYYLIKKLFNNKIFLKFVTQYNVK